MNDSPTTSSIEVDFLDMPDPVRNELVRLRGVIAARNNHIDRLDNQLMDKGNAENHRIEELEDENKTLTAHLAKVTTQLETEASARTTKRLEQEIADERADITRTDTKAQGQMTTVSLVGTAVAAGIVALGSATTTLNDLSGWTIAAAVATIAATMAMMTLLKAAAWPVKRRGFTPVDTSTIASLHAGLAARRDNLAALNDRKFGLLRGADRTMAVTVVLVLATTATVVWG